MYDLVIKNGQIMDGTGNPWFHGDVAIRNERIEGIGSIDDSLARDIIDAKGLVVAPGFVDIHSHGDFVLPVDEHPSILESFVRQGVTTLVTGNCGYSPAPVYPETLDLLDRYSAFVQAPGFTFEWTDMKGFMDFIENKGVAYNVVPMVAHGAIRTAVRGFQAGQASDDELRKMASLVSTAFEQGVFGLTFGLMYAPGVYADTNELIEVSKLVKDFGGLVCAHIRGVCETLIPATKEIIRVGEKNGIPVQHSHLAALGREHWPKIEQVLRLHDEARSRGVDVTFDVFPYVASNTTLLAVLPSWTLEGGVGKVIERLKDVESRKRIVQDVKNVIPKWPPWVPGAWVQNQSRAVGWENIVILSVGSAANRHAEGKNLAQLAREAGKTPFDVAADLIIEEQGQVMAMYIAVSGNKEDDGWLRQVVAHPRAAIGSDAIQTGRGVPHPGAYGCFPKVLGYFSRDLGLMPIEEAVRKMTSLSLQRFGIRDRGLIREGCFADITLFDIATVGEKGSFSSPAQFPKGIRYVIINGTKVLENGVYSGRLCGRVLRKT